MKKLLIVYYSWSNGNTERIAKKLQSAAGGDLLKIAFSDTDGCASVEYAGGGTLLVKELLVPAGRTTAALAAIAERFPCENLVANLPAMPGFDELGSLAPYGVTHWMDSEQEKLLSGRKDGYLGLALD